MSYSINGLSLLICQRILAERLREKGILEHRRSESVYNQEHSGTERSRTQDELDQVNLAIAALETAIAGTTDEDERLKKVLERNRLNVRQTTLQMRLNRTEPESVPDKEYDMKVLDFKLAELEVYIAELQSEITALGG